MTYRYGRSGELVSLDHGRLSWKIFALTLSSVAALALSGIIGVVIVYGHPDTSVAIDPNALPPDAAKVIGLRGEEQPGVMPAIRTEAHHQVAEITYGHLLDLTFELGSKPVTIADSHPLGAEFALAESDQPKVAEAEHLVPNPDEPDEALVQDAPLPAPRPADLTFSPGHGQLRAHSRVAEQQTTTVAAAPAATDNNGNFFDKIFGNNGQPQQQPAGPALAYAAPDVGGLGGLLGGTQEKPAVNVASYGQETAVYDIATHSVYMPDGSILEAHSGLGDSLDDPRSVAEKMRGATPPNVYDLQPRETLFHGVQALRLIPTGNGELYGRAGLLAHTYMLGPNGQSNGCVSFKNYTAFLQAYLHGEIKHLVVIAGI
jgi:hypothetical protein